MIEFTDEDTFSDHRIKANEAKKQSLAAVEKELEFNIEFLRLKKENDLKKELKR